MRHKARHYLSDYVRSLVESLWVAAVALVECFVDRSTYICSHAGMGGLQTEDDWLATLVYIILVHWH